MTNITTLRIREIGSQHVGRQVRVRGWLRNKPGGKGRYFLWLRDGSGEIQAVAEQAVLEALPDGERLWADCERIGIESSLIVEGEVRAHPKHEGVFELGLSGITVVQCVGAGGEHGEYPIGKKDHGVQFLMQHRHLWLRGKRQSAILRIRNEVQKAWADFFYERGFYRVDTPIFTPNACEGTTTLFEVDYHGDTAYLAQSGQLYNEADIGALGQVYCFGPTFRAEKSKTRRHLLEFWMLEMEAAYYDFEDNLRFQEEMMAYTVKRLLSNCLSDLRDLERDPSKLEPATATPYPRIRYGETLGICNDARQAYQALQPAAGKPVPPGAAPTTDLLSLTADIEQLSQRADRMGDEPADRYEDDAEQHDAAVFRWGDDYGAPDEHAIGAKYDRPVFVTHFPVEIKGFYFKDEQEESGTGAPAGGMGITGEGARATKLRIDPVFAALPDHLKVPGTSGHTVLGADLLGPESAGELIGSSQREDDLQRLEQKIAHHNLPREFFNWYVDLRKYGSVPHSGFGIGLERALCWICGGSDTTVHIREAIAFPRLLHQLEP